MNHLERSMAMMQNAVGQSHLCDWENGFRSLCGIPFQNVLGLGGKHVDDPAKTTCAMCRLELCDRTSVVLTLPARK